MSTLIILTIFSSISLLFNTTRLLGIGCSALVAYFHPWLPRRCLRSEWSAGGRQARCRVW